MRVRTENEVRSRFSRLNGIDNWMKRMEPV